MTRNITREDGGNSPKNLLLAKLTTAFAGDNTNFILLAEPKASASKRSLLT